MSDDEDVHADTVQTTMARIRKAMTLRGSEHEATTTAIPDNPNVARWRASVQLSMKGRNTTAPAPAPVAAAPAAPRTAPRAAPRAAAAATTAAPRAVPRSDRKVARDEVLLSQRLEDLSEMGLNRRTDAAYRKFLYAHQGDYSLEALLHDQKEKTDEVEEDQYGIESGTIEELVQLRVRAEDNAAAAATVAAKGQGKGAG